MRNLINAQRDDPYYIMSQAYAEAGDLENSERCLKKSMQRYLFSGMLMDGNLNPKNMFRKDYREIMLSMGGIKKNAIQVVKMFSNCINQS